MKLRHFVTSLAITAVAALGAFVGLSQRKEAKVAKADASDYMFRIQLNSKEAGTWDGDGTISNIRFHYWGKDGTEDYNETVGLSLMNGSDPYGYSMDFNEYVYGANVVLSTSKTVIGGCFILDQVNKKDCYSHDLTSCTFSSDGDYFVREFYYSSWTEEKWNASFSSAEEVPYVDPDSGANVNFTANTALKRWEAKGYEYDPAVSQYFHFEIASGYCTSVLDAACKDKYVSTGSDDNTCWMGFKQAGTYDFYLYDEAEVSGHMVVQKQGPTTSTTIYYVTGEETTTANNVYTFGGTKQFGVWPGTPITSVPGVREITSNGVLHFNGDRGVRIYRIPVKMGYNGDTKIIINYNGSAQSTTKVIRAGAGFYWDTDASYDYGFALGLLDRIEEARNSVTAAGDIKDFSVCGISSSDATDFVNDYNDLSETARGYINNSSIYTYKRNGDAGQEMVGYRYVMEELSEKANIALVDASRINPIFFANANSNTVIIVVVTFSLVAIAALGVCLVIKKKHQ